MAAGFVGPCMLGAMAIIFVAFLAPSGTVVIANFQNEANDRERTERGE
eukprot:CAMPEP_0180130652 /NCGR_PEP_ID=MMETSP0986-20121125/7983_1 /TAXON_ID=697907 /ORGANISM="non described non described, Strain CCMP2293" /LENGTH=47 /DNA_ID= /DNA_START= /DNA_END= /DNA_ORIENTATION=